VIDPRAIVFGVIVDQAITSRCPLVAPGIDLETLAGGAGAASTFARWFRRRPFRGRVGSPSRVGRRRGRARDRALERRQGDGRAAALYVALVFLTAVPAGALGVLLARKENHFDARTALV